MSEIDRTIHPLPRLSICAVLANATDWTEFGTVRDLAQLSDSMLSKHSQVLADADYLEVHKGAVGRRPRTWFRITRNGRKAYESHVAALTELTAVSAGEQSPRDT